MEVQQLKQSMQVFFTLWDADIAAFGELLADDCTLTVLADEEYYVEAGKEHVIKYTSQ